MMENKQDANKNMEEICTDNITVDLGDRKVIFFPDDELTVKDKKEIIEDANNAIESALLDNREDIDILMSIANDKEFVETLSEKDKDYLASCIQEASDKARLLRC